MTVGLAQVAQQRLASRIADRHDALPRALAHDLDSAVSAQIAVPQPGQLRESQARVKWAGASIERARQPVNRRWDADAR